MELNLGATLDLCENIAVYANGSYNIGFDIHAYSYDGRVGFKIKA